MKNQPYKVVLDTNLFVAANFNSKSASAQILRMAKQRKIKTLWSESIRRELEIILNNIKAKTKTRKLIDEILIEKNRLDRLPKIKIIRDDPEDNKFINCALAGNADFIITNDTHLLKLKEFHNIRIVQPREFLKQC